MNKATSHFPQDGSSEQMTTLSSSVNRAIKNGYAANFSIKLNGMMWDDREEYYDPEEVRVDDFYRFEGESDPGDNSILYLISTADGKKGTLIDAYGTYNNADVSDFMRKVSDIHKQRRQLKATSYLNNSTRYIAAGILLAISGILFYSIGKNNK